MVSVGLLNYIFSINESIASKNIDVSNVLSEAAEMIDYRSDGNKYNDYEYKLNIEKHNRENNFHDAIRSVGCGCKLCEIRHSYANAKRGRKWMQKCFFEEKGGTILHFTSIAEKILDVSTINMDLKKAYDECIVYYNTIIYKRRIRLNRAIGVYQNIPGTVEFENLKSDCSGTRQ